MKQNFQNPIKTIEFCRIGLPLACLGSLLVACTLASCGSDLSDEADLPSSSTRIAKDPRDLEMLLPMAPASGFELVVLSEAIPTIEIDLRYAKSDNVSKQRLYDRSMPAMLDAPSTRKLAAAQSSLLQQGYSLKVWDAYRPPRAHLRLWQGSGKSGYVADPRWGWSKHCSGRAIDVTLTDAQSGKELRMPSKFDEFSKRAASEYTGSSRRIRNRVNTLRRAMLAAGFIGIDMEWWHFENATRAQLNLPPIYADEAGVSVP